MSDIGTGLARGLSGSLKNITEERRKRRAEQEKEEREEAKKRKERGEKRQESLGFLDELKAKGIETKDISRITAGGDISFRQRDVLKDLAASLATLSVGSREPNLEELGRGAESGGLESLLFVGEDPIQGQRKLTQQATGLAQKQAGSQLEKLVGTGLIGRAKKEERLTTEQVAGGETVLEDVQEGDAVPAGVEDGDVAFDSETGVFFVAENGIWRRQ